MLTNLVIALAVVLFSIIFDRVQEKATFSFSTHWLKYASVFLLTAFAIPYLIGWKYFQILELAAVGVLFSVFFNLVVNWISEKVLHKPAQAYGLLMEPGNHPNANGSRILALIQIGVFLLCLAGGLIWHIWGTSPLYKWEMLALAILTLISAYINTVNTLETNLDWKTILAVAVGILTILATVIPISAQASAI